MLTRRIFRQLTDSALFGFQRPSPYFHATQCHRLASPSLSTNAHSPPQIHLNQRRNASSSSSTRWKTRQTRDHFARSAKVTGLKSRAAFKLLEIDARYKLFASGQTVVDLGYAPGSWSQVAQAKAGARGRVIGIDVLPVQPPKGVSTIQGNFLSEAVREEVRRYVLDPERGRVRRGAAVAPEDGDDSEEGVLEDGEFVIDGDERGYLEMERHADLDLSPEPALHTEASPEAAASSLSSSEPPARKLNLKERDQRQGRVVDVLLSDMSAPWPQTSSSWVRSVSNVYHRMQNTSGVPFKDHAGSMDLCLAALSFAFDTLRTGGAFVCKFYAGGEDKALEKRLKKLFERVVREKPESSRSESKEAYFIGLRRKENASREDVLGSST